MEKLMIGVIGCGAVTELFHLPVLACSQHFRLEALVDKDLPRARRLSGALSVRHAVSDYRQILDKVDAVIIALPNSLHAPVTIDCLNHGVHALVEKPMAVTAVECDAMIAAADAKRRVLAVGHSKRFFNAHRFIKQAVADGMFGEVRSVDARDGSIFRWPVASNNFFKPEAACGLLLDSGAHVLDLILWWLGDYKSVRYFDDAQGGVEADCEIHLEFAAGSRGFVEMSRTRDLRRTYIIETRHTTIEVDAGWQQPWVRIKTGSRSWLEGKLNSQEFPQPTYLDVLAEQLADFGLAIREGRPPYVDGHEARRCVALMEECSRIRRPLNQPWVDVRGENHV